jgi:hypothetical protein
MCEQLLDVDNTGVIAYMHDEAISISFDAENCFITDKVGVPVGASYILQRCPGFFAGNFAPCVDLSHAITIGLRHGSELLSGNNSHDLPHSGRKSLNQC